MEWYKVPGIVAGKPFVNYVKVAGKSICLISFNGELFALANTCPHAGASLSDGWCEDGKIVCPRHRYTYDITTGRGSPGQNDYVDTYPVKIEEGEIYIGISSFWEKVKTVFK